nr:MAG TPA: hypothetical protein [Caudoviricetes sp.]
MLYGYGRICTSCGFVTIIINNWFARADIFCGCGQAPRASPLSDQYIIFAIIYLAI